MENLVTPVCYINQDRAIPARYEALTDWNNKVDFMNTDFGFKTKSVPYITVREYLTTHGIETKPNNVKPDMDAIVLSITPVTNTLIGGTALYWVSYARNEANRMFGSRKSGFYVSEDKGKLYTAIPA